MEEATDSSDSAKPHPSLQAEEEDGVREEEEVPQLNQDPAAIVADSASTDSANPHASLQAEEEDAEREEEVPELNQDLAAIAAESEEVPSLSSTSASTRTNKKKKGRTLSLSEFYKYNEPSSRPSDAPPPPPPTDPRHCSPTCESPKYKDSSSLFSRWPTWEPIRESENEETAGLAESQASRDLDPSTGSWSIWGNTELAYYSPILDPPGMPPSVIMKLDTPVNLIGHNPSNTSLRQSFDSVSRKPDPVRSILDGGESSWPSLPGTDVKEVNPVIVQESLWKKGTGVVGNGGQSNSESKENAEKEEEAKEETTEETKKETSIEEAKEESTEEAANKEE